MGAGKKPALRVTFDSRLKLEFHGSKVTSDAGLLAYRELDEALGLTDLGENLLNDWRTGKNTQHSMVALMRQSIFSRLAGYEDTNDAERLSVDPTMRQVVGGRATEHTAASTSQMGRFETEVLTQPGNLAALTKLSGKWIDRLRERQPMRELILDMDSSVSETYGEQEGTAYNGHFGCTCYHPLFCFNQFGDVERSLLREGNVHSAKDWRAVLEPVVARYQGRKIPRYFRADAAFANPELYEYLEAEGFEYAIRLPGNDALLRDIEPMLTRPVGRPSNAPVVWYAGFLYQAKSWNQRPARGGQGGMAQRRTVPSRRVHRDQSNPARQTGGAVLQPAGHGGAVDQGRQERGQMDAPVLSRLCGQPGAAATVRAGLQPGQLPAAGGAAPSGASLDVDDVAGEIDQDRGEGRAPFPEDDLPDGGSGGAARVVPGHFGRDWAAEIACSGNRMKKNERTRMKTMETTEEVSSDGMEKCVERHNWRQIVPVPEKNRGRTGKSPCKSVEQAENHKKGPRWSWA